MFFMQRRDTSRLRNASCVAKLFFWLQGGINLRIVFFDLKLNMGEVADDQYINRQEGKADKRPGEGALDEVQVHENLEQRQNRPEVTPK